MLSNTVKDRIKVRAALFAEADGVAVDPGLTHMGVAAFKAGEPLVSVSLPFVGDDLERSQQAAVALRSLLVLTADSVPLYIEMPGSLYVPKGRDLNALKFLLNIGAVAGATHRKVIGVPVQAWAGNMPKAKSAVERSSLTRLEKERRVALANYITIVSHTKADVFDHHEADAVLIGLFAHCKLAVWGALSLMRQGVDVAKAWASAKELKGIPPTDLSKVGTIRSKRGRAR